MNSPRFLTPGDLPIAAHTFQVLKFQPSKQAIEAIEHDLENLGATDIDEDPENGRVQGHDHKENFDQFAQFHRRIQ